MASEPAHNLPEQNNAICPTHGLRYDPRLASGCIRCRKTRDEIPTPYAGRIGLLLTFLGLGALAFPLRTAIRSYWAPPPAGSAPILPVGAPAEHRHCLSVEGTMVGLSTVVKDCVTACEAGWGASCRRLAGLCSPSATLPSKEACTQGPVALLEQACKRQDPIACSLLAEQKKAEILWKACDSGLGLPCAEIAPLCDPERTALTEGAPTTAWAFFAHPALQTACSGGVGQLYERGCAQGDWSSCENPLVRTKITPDRLRELLEHACDQADTGACRRLATLVNESSPALANVLLAFAKEMDACTGGDCSQVRNWRSRISEEQPRILQREASSSEDACLQQNLVVSCWEAAEAYAVGNGVKKDLNHSKELNSRARNLLKEGCKTPGGDCASPDMLRLLEDCDHEQGEACLAAVKKQAGDPQQTAVLFRRGVRYLQADCDRHQGAACWGLAKKMMEGGLPGDEAAQIELLKKGCDGRSGLSCYELANRVAEGRGIPQNRTDSERLFRKATEQLPMECSTGGKAACSALAEIFEVGKGVPRDEAKAASYRAQEASTAPPATSH